MEGGITYENFIKPVVIDLATAATAHAHAVHARKSTAEHCEWRGVGKKLVARGRNWRRGGEE